MIILMPLKAAADNCKMIKLLVCKKWLSKLIRDQILECFVIRQMVKVLPKI